MTRAQITRSLKLWQEREERFRRNWRSKRKADPRRGYWYLQLKNAKTWAARRRKQLAALGVAGISDAGVKLVKRFEGFRSDPYQDSVGVWTIGYGETRGVTRHTPPVTEPHAAAQLRRRLDRDYFPAVQSLPTFRRLNQQQVDALVSFVYNVGPGALTNATGIGRALRAGRFNEAADHLLDWDKAGGKHLAGLTARRRAERTLFLSQARKVTP